MIVLYHRDNYIVFCSVLEIFSYNFNFKKSVFINESTEFLPYILIILKLFFRLHIILFRELWRYKPELIMSEYKTLVRFRVFQRIDEFLKMNC